MINNSLFKLEEVPDFHPIIDKYESLSFWRNEKRKCMEGVWQFGKWIPGELYYYINFHNIVVEKGNYKGLGLPFFRDLEFEMFYIFTEAIGFSGFKDDDEFTCHRAVKSYYSKEITKEELKNDHCYSEGSLSESFYNGIFKKDGSVKKYIEAREYLRKIHKKELGKPLYHNQAKHLMLLGARGFG